MNTNVAVFTPRRSNPHVDQLRRSLLAARLAKVLNRVASRLNHRPHVAFADLPLFEQRTLRQMAEDLTLDLADVRCMRCGEPAAEDSDMYCQRCKVLASMGR